MKPRKKVSVFWRSAAEIATKVAFKDPRFQWIQNSVKKGGESVA